MSRDLSGVKVGDKVFKCMSGWGRFIEIRTVTKVGKLHITINDTGKYRISSGRQAGSYYGTVYLEPFDQKTWDEYCAEKEFQRKRNAVENFEWRNGSKDLIEKVYELLPKKAEASHD